MVEQKNPISAEYQQTDFFNFIDPKPSHNQLRLDQQPINVFRACTDPEIVPIIAKMAAEADFRNEGMTFRRDTENGRWDWYMTPGETYPVLPSSHHNRTKIDTAILEVSTNQYSPDRDVFNRLYNTTVKQLGGNIPLDPSLTR